MVLSTLTHLSNERGIWIFLRNTLQSSEFPAVQSPRHRPHLLRDKGSLGDLSWFRQPERMLLEEKEDYRGKNCLIAN